MLARVFATGTPEKLAEQEHGPRDEAGGGWTGKSWSYSAWAILGPSGNEGDKPVGVMIQVTDTTASADFHRRMEAINGALIESGVRQNELRAEAEKLNAELRQSEERFGALIEASSEVVYRMSADWSEMHHLEGRGFIADTAQPSRTWLEKYIHRDDQQRVMEAISEAVRTKSIFALEYRVRRVDGSLGWTSSRAIPILDEGGEVVEWFGTASDVTGRKLAEAALLESEKHEREARLEAQDANHTKDVFLATLSHELRNPLNAILGWAVVLRTRSNPLDEDLARGLAIIERNARAQATLINDVLDVARITSGKFMLDILQVDLPALVFAAVEAVRPSTDDRKITLDVSGDGGGVGSLRVLGDAVRLHQAVANLLTNACKFTPTGGRVSVLVERVKEVGGDKARVTVTDTGQGIAPEFLPYIFVRFKQAEEGTTRSHGGLGIGLSIVRHIMAAHAGTARAESKGVGLGATFTLELPAIPESSASLDAEKPNRSVPLPRLDGLRVLVVDDEADSRILARMALVSAGATVVLAASAEEGYQLAVKSEGDARPQVLVSDIGMPGEDGYSMRRRVRAELALEQLPAVAMTAFAAPEDKRRALQAGFQVHLPKPIEAENLIVVVAGLAGRKVV
ncbi:MAG: ATP-binding protein, partial [Planctomycetota bacterium]